MRKKWIVVLMLCLSVILLGCDDKQIGEVSTIVEEDVMEETDVEDIPIPEDIEIQISAVGDIMVHGPQLKAQHHQSTGEYAFDNNFKHVIPYFQQADLMLGNLETTFAGETRGYSSYPLFNTPDSLADSLKSAGFHAIATANNHSFDTGKEGMLRTLDILREKGLKTFGTRKDTDEESFSIVDIKGIKVGLTAYTYETPRWKNYKTINAIKIPLEVEPLIDTFSYEFLQEDLLVIQQRVEEMRKQGAEVVVFYIHWGNEYQREPNQYQKTIAQELSNFGVDIIFGSHPHVIQPIEIIASQVDNKQTVVVYSMGNFLSNQRYEILKNRFTEDGVIVNVKLIKSGVTNQINLEEITYVPTWVHRYFVGGKAVYEILPTDDVIKMPMEYGIATENSKWRVENSHQNTVTIIESNGEATIPILLTRVKE